MEFLTVVNRTNQSLIGTWNGRQFEVPPGESAYPEAVARAIKRQNPVMGSGDPRDDMAGMTGRMDYKVGIKEHNDPCTPIEIDPNAVERWNRDQLVGARPSEIVAGDNGLYATKRSAVAGSLPVNFDGHFVPDPK